MSYDSTPTNRQGIRNARIYEFFFESVDDNGTAKRSCLYLSAGSDPEALNKLDHYLSRGHGNSIRMIAPPRIIDLDQFDAYTSEYWLNIP